MRFMRSVPGLGLVAVLVLSVISGQVAAQEQLPGATVQEPWRVELTQRSPDGTREVVVLSGINDNLILGTIAVGSDSGDPIADIQQELATRFLPVTDINRGSTYALQASVIDGVPYGHFTLVISDPQPGIIEVHSYISPVSTFATGMDSLREFVTIDGAAPFEGVDGAALQGLLTGEVGTGDAIADAELAPLLAALGETEDTSAVNESIADSVDHMKYSDAGVIDANTWVSPTHAMKVTWSDDWMLAPDTESPSAGSGDFDSEYVSLVRTDNPEARFGVVVFPSSVGTIGTWVSSLDSQLSLSPINTIVMAESAGEAGGIVGYDPHWGFIHDYSMSDDGATVVWAHLRTPVETLQGDFDSAASGITINGGPAFTYVTPADIDPVRP